MKHSYKRFLAMAFSTVVWSAALCGCHSKAPVSDSSAASSQMVEQGCIGIYSSFPTLPVREYPEYMSAGYSCKIQEFSQYAQPLEALTAGKVDICVAALPSVLQAQLDGHTVKILCNFYQKGLRRCDSGNEGNRLD